MYPIPIIKRDHYRLARLWFALLELAWDHEQGNPPTHPQKQRGGDSNGRRGSPTPDDGGRSIELARKAAVAVLRSGPWSPDRNRELVVLQVMGSAAVSNQTSHLRDRERVFCMQTGFHRRLCLCSALLCWSTVVLHSD